MRISDWSSDVCSSDLFGGRCFFEDPFGVISMLKACSTTGAHRSLRTPDGEHCHRGGADPHRSALNCRRPTRLRSRVSGSSIELRGIEPGHRISTKTTDRDEKPAVQSTVKTVVTASSLLFRLRLLAMADSRRAFLGVRYASDNL